MEKMEDGGNPSVSARLSAFMPIVRPKAYKGLFALESAKDDYTFETKRFRSFTKWPYRSNTQCMSIQMAAAGWYCTNADPEDPTAKCAFCLKELSGWEPTDDPWKEHKKHSGGCAFLKLNKEQKDFTVEDMYKMFEARKLKMLEKELEQMNQKLEEKREKTLELIKNMKIAEQNQEDK